MSVGIRGRDGRVRVSYRLSHRPPDCRNVGISGTQYLTPLTYPRIQYSIAASGLTRGPNLPEFLNLAQPFPNPTRTRFNISYALPRPDPSHA
jgi:hypothetical protein